MVSFATIMCITIGWFVFDIIVKGYWQDYIGHYFINEILISLSVLLFAFYLCVNFLIPSLLVGLNGSISDNND